MASLIKKIQKSVNRADDQVSDVIIYDNDGMKLQTSGLSEKYRNGSGGDSNKIAAVEPIWLRSQKSIPTEVVILLNSSFKVLKDLSKEDIKDRAELELIVSTSLDRAKRGLAGEISLSRYDLLYAEHELEQLAFGFGPLSSLLEDSQISEIFVDSYNEIRVRRDNKVITTPISFRSPLEYELFLKFLEDRSSGTESTVGPCKQYIFVGKEVVRCSILDAKESSESEPRLCVRVSRPEQVTFYNLLRQKVLPVSVAGWLSDVAAASLANVLIIGPTGSGKSRMQTALLNASSSEQRIISVEELPNILLSNANHEPMIIEDLNREQGASELLQCAMQRAPHKIALDEIRGIEAATFLSVLEQGLDGCISTINSNTVRESLWKFADLVMRADLSPESSIVRRIERTVKLVLKMSVVNGEPILAGVYELIPSPRAPFSTRELIRFDGYNGSKPEWLITSTTSPLMEAVKERTGTELEVSPGLKQF